MPGLGEIAALAGALSWGVTSLLMRSEARRVDVILLNATRTALASVYVVALPLALIALGLHHTAVGGQPLLGLALLLLSVVCSLGLGDTLYFLSMQRIGVTRAMPIAMSNPLLTTALAIPILGEPVTTGLILGIFLIPAGLYLVTVPPRGRVVSAPKADARVIRTGVLMALAAAVFWSCSSIVLRPALNSVDVLTASAIRMPAGALLSWVLAWRTGRIPRARSGKWPGLWMTVVMGTLSASSMLLNIYGLQQAGAARTSALSSTSPVYALPLSALFLGETLSRRMIVGTLITVVGVILLVML